MKYRNTKTEVDGIKFDSLKEARRWQELRLLQRAGEITNLDRQVPYILIPTQKDVNGKVIERECKYIADFVYREPGNPFSVVEDTKGMKTKDYIIKRKLMLYVYKIKIREV